MRIVLAAAVLMLTAGAIRALVLPLRWGGKLLINAGAGLATLLAFNLIGARVGLMPDLTALNVMVAGVFGVPGVVALAACTLI